jgi:hypothetical protein
MMRRKGLNLIVVALALAASRAAAQSAPPAPASRGEERTLTGKERLAGKAADEQRVDDCKVRRSGADRARGRRHAMPLKVRLRSPPGESAQRL